MKMTIRLGPAGKRSNLCRTSSGSSKPHPQPSTPKLVQPTLCSQNPCSNFLQCGSGWPLDPFDLFGLPCLAYQQIPSKISGQIPLEIGISLWKPATSPLKTGLQTPRSQSLHILSGFVCMWVPPSILETSSRVSAPTHSLKQTQHFRANQDTVPQSQPKAFWPEAGNAKGLQLLI